MCRQCVRTWCHVLGILLVTLQFPVSNALRMSVVMITSASTTRADVFGGLRMWSELAAMRYYMEGPVDSDPYYTREASYMGRTAGNPRGL